MKKTSCKMLVAGVLVASTLACFAAPYEDLDTSVLRIDGVEITASAAELNIMDGVTATAAELNIMDGVTATAAQINQATNLYGNSTITGDAGAAAQLFMTNVIQTVAGDGVTPILDYAVIHAWISETDVGSASTNNIEALTLSGGTAVSTVTAKADYWYVTASTGEVTVVVEGTASSTTNYLMISVGPQVNSKAIVFVTP